MSKADKYLKQVNARCRNCGWRGHLKVRPRWKSQKGGSITGVPCKKCGQHKLERR